MMSFTIDQCSRKAGPQNTLRMILSLSNTVCDSQVLYNVMSFTIDRCNRLADSQNTLKITVGGLVLRDEMHVCIRIQDSTAPQGREKVRSCVPLSVPSRVVGVFQKGLCFAR